MHHRLAVAVTLLGLLAGTLMVGGCGRTSRPAVNAAAPSTTTTPPSGRYLFPVRYAKPGYAHWHTAYPATDIFAPCGAPVVAVTDGVVLELSRVDTFGQRPHDGAAKGGQFVSVAGDDGVRYYGSHLSVIDARVKPGLRVRAGDQLGLVGRTGNASNICHLHFGLSPPCKRTGDWWIRRGVVYPWPFLDAWRNGKPRSPVLEVSAWHRAHGCPTATPPE